MTIRERINQISFGQQVRENLTTLREEIKEEARRRELAMALGGDFRPLLVLLHHEDPKVRKNAALLLGEMESEDVLGALISAWQEETTLYVRPSYIKAMQKLSCRRYLGELKAGLERLDQEEPSEENVKHVQEERKALLEIINRYEKHQKHVFNGYSIIDDVILLTNREHREVTAGQIKEGKITMMGGGLRVRGGNLEEILSIRTWQEWLIPLPGARPLAGTAAQIGRELFKLEIGEFLDRIHEGDGPFQYRLEIKSQESIQRKGNLIRSICSILDSYSEGKLRNNSSDYETEIRLTQRKDGSYVPMLKLFTLEDKRFSYRKETTASSMAPVNAATIMQLAMPYLKEGAQVLDPFCGTGTLLIERRLALNTGDLYGVDTNGEAIEKARVNAGIIGLPIHYINRSFLDFEHEYLFDEIVSDLPGDTEDNLYARIPAKAASLLKDGSILVLYTVNPDRLTEAMKADPRYQLQNSWIINERLGTKAFVWRCQKS